MQSAASPKRGRRLILWCLLALVLLGLALGGRFALRLLTRPESLFAAATPVPTATPALSLPAFPVEDVPVSTPTDAPRPTGSPVRPNILNVMLMGIDAYENGGTTSGTMPHTDVRT